MIEQTDRVRKEEEMDWEVNGFSLPPSPPPPVSSHLLSAGRTIGPPVARQRLGRKDVALADRHWMRPIKSWRGPWSLSEWHHFQSLIVTTSHTRKNNECRSCMTAPGIVLNLTQISFQIHAQWASSDPVMKYQMAEQAERKSRMADSLAVFTVRDNEKMNVIQINTVGKTSVHNK